MTDTVGYTNSAKYKCLENLPKGAVDLCLTYCGWERCAPNFRFGPNRRISWVLHLIQEGEGIYEINKRRYALKRGDVFLIPPGAEAWYQADRRNPWTYRWIGFEGMNAEGCLAAAGLGAQNLVRRIRCLSRVSGCIDQILEAHQLSYENELRRNALLMMIFAELISDNRALCPEEGPERPQGANRYPSAVYVDHAVEYIRANYTKRLKIQELASYIGVNRSYLTSSFQKIQGCSPQEYLINIRIEKAKALLQKTDLSVSEVAVRVGYADPLAFSKSFKKRTGRSPREYKEEKKHLVMLQNKGDFKESET